VIYRAPGALEPHWEFRPAEAGGLQQSFLIAAEIPSYVVGGVVLSASHWSEVSGRSGHGLHDAPARSRHNLCACAAGLQPS